jgi:hypothetical protein
MVFNPVKNQYFAVWVVDEGAGKNHIMGARLTESGDIIDKVMLITSDVVPQPKRNPYVAYSPKLNIYVILFELYYSDTDVDIWAVDVSATGKNMGAFPIATSAASEDRPTLSYDPKTEGFVFAYESDYTFESTNPISGPSTITNHYIKLGKLDAYGRPLPLQGYDPNSPNLTSLNIGSHDSRPNLVYHPIAGDHLLTFAVDTSGQGTPAIYDAFVTSELSVFAGYRIGQWTLGGELIAAHSPRAFYNPSGDYNSRYFIVYELDVDGNDSGRTMIVATTLDFNGISYPNPIFLNGNLTRNRNPSVAYSGLTDDYIVTFAQDDRDGKFSVRSTTVSAQTLKTHHVIDPLNDADSAENWPVVTYNTKKGTFLTAWTSGDPEDQDDQEKRNFKEFSGEIKFVQSQEKYELKFGEDSEEMKRASIEKRDNPQKRDISVAKRQAAKPNTLKAKRICSSDSVGFGEMQVQVVGDKSRPALIGVSVFLAIFGVLLLGILGYFVNDRYLKSRRSRAAVELQETN